MTNLGLNDGLWSGEKKANDLVFNEMVSGASPGYFKGVTTGSIVSTNQAVTGSISMTDKLFLESAGSPFGKGIVYSFPCAGAITGGQLVTLTSGATVGTMAVAATANSQANGMAYGTANYASGTAAVIPVVVFGPAYLNACANIGTGDYAITGSVAHMIQSGAFGPNVVGKCFRATSSGTTAPALVFIGKL